VTVIRSLLAASFAAALMLALALGPAAGLAQGDSASWRLEKVLPPQLPGETGEQHEQRFPVPLGKIGDIEFFAPNRGLLVTAGNPPTIPPGVWAYNGKEWRELASVCGASDGRIAWAGPDEFWTVSDQRPGQTGSERPPPLEDNSLCHFRQSQAGGPLEVVGSYASLAFRADSYQAMHAAGCLSPGDCWFGGELLPEGEAGVKAGTGAFQLHWDGTSVSAEPYPAEHPIEDMRAFGRYLFESVRVRQQDHLAEGESPSAPSDLHLITPITVQPRFISLTPGFPRYAPGERPYALDFPHLSSDETDLWGAANPVLTPSESAPGEVTVLRSSGSRWNQVLGYGTDPSGGNPFTQPARAERENETISSVGAEPGTQDAWLALTSLENSAADRSGAAPAMVARLSATGEVSERQTLPSPGEGVGLKGAADEISCPAANDCWLATTRGWLFHYADAAHRQLSENGDPAFSSLVTTRPPDAGIPPVVPDAPPVDDSGLLGEIFAPSGSLPQTLLPAELRIPVPLVTRVRTRLIRGTTLELRFHLAVVARVRLLARRARRVVGQTPLRTLGAGDHALLLRLNRKSWPTKLDLQTHALAPLPTTSTRGAGNTTVGTGVVVLPRTRSFAQAGALP
jgi:hypothetical protein